LGEKVEERDAEGKREFEQKIAKIAKSAKEETGREEEK
jgi:hypothetical protein